MARDPPTTRFLIRFRGRQNNGMPESNLMDYALPCIRGTRFLCPLPDSAPRSRVGGGFWCREDEGHPGDDRNVLLPFIQIVLRELPFVPKGMSIDDIICIYIGPTFTVEGDSPCPGFMVRQYDSRCTRLIPCQGEPVVFADGPKLLGWSTATDYPDEIHVPSEELCGDPDREKFPCLPGIKIGGWPLGTQGFVDEPGGSYFMQFPLRAPLTVTGSSSGRLFFWRSIDDEPWHCRWDA